MFCIHCGHAVPSDGGFCPNCGMQTVSTTHDPVARASGSTHFSGDDPIFHQALQKVVSRIYACDYCGAALDVVEGSSKTKCTSCGYVNEVNYLRQVSARVREEKAAIIKSAMDTFAQVTNLQELNLSLHERFLAAAHIYENRATRLEDEVGKINSYSENIEYHEAKAYYRTLAPQKQWYDASKSWHQVADLYQNAAEFASSPEEEVTDRAASRFYDGLALFDVSLAPIWFMTQSRPRSELTHDWGKTNDSESENVLEKELRKAEHPLLINPDAAVTALHSALDATDSFLTAYELIHEPRYLAHALVAKLLGYILYAESIRDNRLIGLPILHHMSRIARDALFTSLTTEVPPPRPSNGPDRLPPGALESIVKRFAEFITTRFDDYLSGLHAEWKERGIWPAHVPRREPVGMKYGGFSRLFLYDVTLSEPTSFKVDTTLSQVTKTLTLTSYVEESDYDMRPRRQQFDTIGFQFAWVIGRYRTGFFSYGEPTLRLAIDATNDVSGILAPHQLFTNCFRAFLWLTSCLSNSMTYLGKGYADEVSLKVGIGKELWYAQMPYPEYFELYHMLYRQVMQIDHPLMTKIREQRADMIQYNDHWSKKMHELATLESVPTPPHIQSHVFTPSYFRHDNEYLKFLLDHIAYFPTPEKTLIDCYKSYNWDRISGENRRADQWRSATNEERGKMMKGSLAYRSHCSVCEHKKYEFTYKSRRCCTFCLPILEYFDHIEEWSD